MRAKLNFNFCVGIVLEGSILFIMLLSLFYSPYDVNAMDASNRFLHPTIKHLLGTDNFGRDILSRIMEGTKFTLLVATSTVSISLCIGTILGTVAAYKNGIFDEIIMRLIDALTSFPGILLALVIVTVLNKGNYAIIISLSILFTPSFTRIVRTGVLKYIDSDFIKSARVFGASGFRIMFFHILPNIYSDLISAISVGLSNAIIAESSMSYLGLGIQPPTPSWGRMLFEAQTYLFNAPWYALASGIIIMVTVIGFNCIGEGIQQKYC